MLVKFVKSKCIICVNFFLRFGGGLGLRPPHFAVLIRNMVRIYCVLIRKYKKVSIRGQNKLTTLIYLTVDYSVF